MLITFKTSICIKTIIMFKACDQIMDGGTLFNFSLDVKMYICKTLAVAKPRCGRLDAEMMMDP